jgi:hypothetical protein
LEADVPPASVPLAPPRLSRMSVLAAAWALLGLIGLLLAFG